MFYNAIFNRKGNRFQLKGKTLHLEALEDRTLLSASPMYMDPTDVVPAFVAPAQASENLAPDSSVVADLGEAEPQAPETLPVALNASYNANDVTKLRTFLELTDENGVKNGVKINSEYSSQNVSTWTGVTWAEANGSMRVTQIFWPHNELVGSLDVSSFTALTTLNCYYNQLTGLNVSWCSSLKDLQCGSNQLTFLDVSKNTELSVLSCYSNLLTSLDVSKNTALTEFYCADNPLTSLDVTKNTALLMLWCDNNQLTSLDVSKNTALDLLWCSDNQLTSLDVSKNTSLTHFYCDNNQLTSLDVSKNTALESLHCTDNPLTSLDVSKNTALSYLNCSENQLTSLDVSKNTALIILTCRDNQLTFLDVSKNTALTDLDCGSNQLTTLDMSKNTLLDYLRCSCNQLTSLDMSKNTELTVLTCSYNQLASLNISNCTELQKLYCYDNRMTEVDVTNNTALTLLNLGINQLTSLDVSKNTALTWLDCSSNQLTSVDVSKNVSLENLFCWNSGLNNVVLPSERSSDVTICLSRRSETEWTFKDANGNALEADEYEYDDVNYSCGILATATSLPVYATSASGGQRILFTDQAYEPEVNARIVFQDSLKNVDMSSTLPTGISSTRAGKTVYAEIWLKDIESTDPAIIGAYMNMLYDNDALTVENVTYGTVFTQFNNIQNASVPGVIDLIGGGVTQGVSDKGDDEWVRLATVCFIADSEGSTTVSLAAPNDYHDNVTRVGGVILANEQIDFGSAVLEVTAACPMDIDGDGYIGMSDYALLSAAWRSSPGKSNWNPACDIDGDSYVGLSDYAFLSSNWRKYITDPDLVYPGVSVSPAALPGDVVICPLDQQVLEVDEPTVVSMAAAAFNEENSGDLNNPVALEADETANVRLTAVSTKSASDVAANVPASLEQINPGDSFFVEIWVRNMNGYQGSNLCGLIGGYLNMEYPSDLLTVGNVTYGSVFSQFTNYQNASVPGVIDLIGGGVTQGVSDKGDDEWVRLATVEFTASETGIALIESLPPTDFHDNLTLSNGKTLKNDEISFGSLSLTVGTIVIQLTAKNDFVKTTLNNSVLIDYLKNDIIPDASETTVEFGNATYGGFVVNANGTITYTPKDGFYGTDLIPYVLVSPSELAPGAIAVSVGLPIATSVQKTSSVHTPTSAMAASVDSLTDWDCCYIELWAQGVNELNTGETTITLEYNPAVYAAPVLSDCADGAALSVSQSVLLPNGNVQVELTAQVLEPISSQTDNLFLGTVVLTPSLEDGAGVEDVLTPEPVCVVDGVSQASAVGAMPYDIIHNDAVDVNDFVAFATVYGLQIDNLSPENPLYAQAVMADFNKDGIVNVDDFIMFATNYGASKQKTVIPTVQASAAAVPTGSEEFDNSEFGMQNAELIESKVESAELELALPVSQLESESVMTLLEARSAALLDLYDNFDRADLSDVSDVLAESRMDSPTSIYSDGDAPKTSNDVSISAVLDEDFGELTIDK